MRPACTSGMMETIREVRTLRATGNEEDDYAHVRGAAELDRGGDKERQGNHGEDRRGHRAREEAWNRVPASLLDGGALRHGCRFRVPGRRDPERPSTRDLRVGVCQDDDHARLRA